MKKVFFQLKKICLQIKGFAHTEKRFAYIHKTNPRQILTTSSHSKFSRQVAAENSYGKFP